jgi:hypothetical protein
METSTRHMDREENKLKNKKKMKSPNEVMNVSQQNNTQTVKMFSKSDASTNGAMHKCIRCLI